MGERPGGVGGVEDTRGGQPGEGEGAPCLLEARQLLGGEGVGGVVGDGEMRPEAVETERRAARRPAPLSPSPLPDRPRPGASRCPP